MSSVVPIPIEASVYEAMMRDCGAVLGKRGSGKSTTARKLFETEVDRGHRCGFIDPMGDAAGIRLEPDGKTPSRFGDVIIFGGPNGDIPIGDEDGAKVARIIAGRAVSFIVDLSEMVQGRQQHFMGAFADALYDEINVPITLFVDEAHVFAPQDRSEGGGSYLLNRMNRLNSQGRKRGIFLWLMTQRPARINKNILAGTETLIAMKVTISQDLDALTTTLEAHDPAVAKEIRPQLSKLKPGEAFVWQTTAGYLERIQFPMPSTFDSGRTPAHGETLNRMALPPANLGELASLFAETPQGDPRDAEIEQLRGQVASLRRSESDLIRQAETASLREEHFTRTLVRIQNLIGLVIGSRAIQPIPYGHNPELYHAHLEADGVIRPVLKAGDVKPAVADAMKRTRSTKEK